MQDINIRILLYSLGTLLLKLDFGFVFCNQGNVIIPYLWRNIEFRFPSDASRDAFIQNGSYVSQNVVLNDVDVWEDKVRGVDTGGYRIFVSTPRTSAGIPATLSTITSVKNGQSFLLAPFPDLQSQSQAQAVNSGDCGGLVLVDKMHIDRCGLLWAIDTGRINEFVSPTRVCQPKLLIFDLRDNDRLVERYEFPDGVVNAGSTVTTTVTDSRTDTCRDAVAYIADLNGNGLVVFDWPTRTSWRVNHNYFYPYPRYGHYTIAGVTFDLMDGVFGMALGPIRPDSDRLLYFHSLASIRESYVPTSVLRNQSLVSQPNNYRSRFSLSGEFRVGQCSLEVITDDGIMIYSDLPRNALMCWNTATPAVKENTQMIHQDNTHLQFISGLKLKGDNLWISSNQVQNLMGNVTTTDFRYRILFVKSVRLLLQENGKKCLNVPGLGIGVKGPLMPPIRPPIFPGKPPSVIY